MANIHAPDFNNKPLHMSAYGNAWADDYAVTAAPAIADKVYFGIIPAGVRIYSVVLKHHAAGADATAKLGFEPMEDDTPAADDSYWLPGSTATATAGVKTSTAAPITFDRPVKLVLTAAGANYASGTLSVVVNGKVIGIA
ncbi:hypothetical protein RE432_14855 [Pusillimonas sp. SM2304]|uniref:hypothetical protein n=1 Tax=Pusillimonas sp. SM2304 TaxID=3073241 RepID=UPI002875409A|nr:hypothetical protein [Pusillimonas sp. SM2304]MDS1141719.1 hypothetical protein [Pusillimonas sp. SM2304]